MYRKRPLSFGLLITFALVLSFLIACAVAPTPTPTSAPAPTKAAAEPTKAAPAPTKAAEATKPAAAPTKAAAAPKPAGPPEKVIVGLKGNAPDAGFFIALDKGYFAQQNIEFTTQSFDTLAQSVPPLATGQIDVGAGGLSPGIFNAVQRDISIKVVADKGLASPGMGSTALVVRKDLWDSGAIKEIKDLKGRNVALNAAKAGSATHVVIDMALSKVGLSLKDINIIDVGFPDMNAAFASKVIDASFQIEPLVAKGVEQGLFHRWAGIDAFYPNQQVAVVAYSPKFAKERNEVAKRFMVAYVKGLRDYNDAFVKRDKKARDEVLPILMKNTDLKDRSLYEKVEFIGLNPDGYVNADSIAADQDWYVANGFLNSKANLKELIDNQFVDYAIQTLGKYQK
ncbi:MAG: ABC transporter substrate-binding protein [Chloroflexi bacterium]|nr:ABC transporter substrate-binding protein [Chloroflexota bacterium]